MIQIWRDPKIVEITRKWRFRRGKNVCPYCGRLMLRAEEEAEKHQVLMSYPDWHLLDIEINRRHICRSKDD